MYVSKYPLPHGRKNAQTAAALCDRYNITRKQFLKDIHARKKNGEAVCTTGAPPRYFLAVRKYEVKDYCGHLYFKAMNILSEYRDCRKLIDTLPD